jgi:2-dehydro-3-deoxyphosphogluconate aldolase / (4S)-4-hydroxy-2-oxoglutarate aldolase
VLDAHTVVRAVESGAKFVVSPILKEAVVRRARELETPVMPGAFTPTEIQTAWEYGADVVKVFPADVLGMPYLKSVLAPLPHLKLLPTGGVTLTNGGDWLRAGAWALGLGSALVDKQALQRRDFALIRRNAETLIAGLTEDRIA